MLQRPQSVFLAIAAICLIVSLFLPVWVKSVPEPDKQLTLHRTHLVKDSASGEAQSTPKPQNPKTPKHIVKIESK